jgi:SAM-dependent methyltransferase
VINQEKVHNFWEKRGEKLGQLPFDSIANLEEKPELLDLKINLEQQRIMPLLPLGMSKSVLDLGAGVGQWTFRFAPLVKKVVAVEYANSLAEIGRAEVLNRGANNVQFITSPAEQFVSAEQFDIVFISGLFVYMTDEQVASLMKNLPGLVKPDGVLLLRDGTSILSQRHIIDNRFSDILKEYYSAVYRTRDEYIALFEKAGFERLQDGQVFDEGCSLNKFSETRLWYYQFRLKND